MRATSIDAVVNTNDLLRVWLRGKPDVPFTLAERTAGSPPFPEDLEMTLMDTIADHASSKNSYTVLLEIRPDKKNTTWLISPPA